MAGNGQRENGKLYQDRLYGTKWLSPLAVAIVDSAEFQRLAHLKQLGFADIAYRSAQHTRMEHCIGTHFVSRRMMRRIAQNHDRLMLSHPGRYVSKDFAIYPHDWKPDGLKFDDKNPSHMARWRGLAEVVSAAALLHDLGHVPFGHTLEDEFAGIFPKHDRLAGPRAFQMFFDESSELASVFSDALPRWIDRLSNTHLGQLIYLILSWKEDIDDRLGFKDILAQELRMESDAERTRRLEMLQDWHSDFTHRQLFHPFMSDIVGNTICADMLDYLPRDRQNLGMEPHQHDRLQRYFVIKKGTLLDDEGYRVSIMVTRKGHGGQRKDVATAVLDVMRERYEMAERVYYHHKKAAASTMLAKLAELAEEAGQSPRDDAAIYPAPWNDEEPKKGVPHMIHLGDAELIDYLGQRVQLRDPQKTALQRRLYHGLRYRRNRIYRTLLVIDTGLVQSTTHDVEYYANYLRGNAKSPSKERRALLERHLAEAAGVEEGKVLVYCPSPKMQAKVVDVRVEIREGGVMPLRVQRESFTYRSDLEVLERYYADLWRAYVFVAPNVYEDALACSRIIDRLCEILHFPREATYTKVRGHEYKFDFNTAIDGALLSVRDFVADLGFDVPSPILTALLEFARSDLAYLEAAKSDADAAPRLSALLEVVVVESVLASGSGVTLSRERRKWLDKHQHDLRTGETTPRLAAARTRASGGGEALSFARYRDGLLNVPISHMEADGSEPTSSQDS